MDTKHTPTPWGLDDNHGKRYIEPIDDNAPVAIVCKHKDFQANGEFIIRACNAHEDLIETLQYCKSWFEKYSPQAQLINNLGSAPHPMLININETLKKIGRN